MSSMNDFPVPELWLIHLYFTLLCLILLREAVVSMDRGIKTLFRAIWMRKSGSIPGSESREKIGVSYVKILVGAEGDMPGRILGVIY